MIEVVIFDMAGTTVDEGNVVYKSVQAAIQDGGFQCSLEDVLHAGAGKHKLQAIRDVLQLLGADCSEAEIQAIYKDFQEKLQAAYQGGDFQEADGASALFQFLRSQGVKVVLNTGYDREIATMLVNRIGWQEQKDFDLLVTASDVKAGRPAPDMIDLALKTLGGISSDSAIKVGDSQVDIEEGKNAGCKFSVGITTGAQTKAQLAEAKPTHIVEHLREIAELVKVTAGNTAS